MKYFLLLSAIFCCKILAAQEKLFTVHFDFNKYDLTETTIYFLDSLSAHSGSIRSIELTGHCDKIGNDTYNDQLSLRRIDAVKQYLLSKGLAESIFIRSTGFGKRKPLNDNVTDIDRALNRRVELLVVENEPARIPVPDTVIKPAEPEKDTSSLLTQIERQISDSSATAPQNIILKNLNFIAGRHVLVKESFPVADELVEVMKKFPTLKIEIQGHICCVFNDGDGLDFDFGSKDLSVRRAEAIYNYLVDHGIDAGRLSYKGFGSTKPLFYPEKNENEKLQNRRVEIQIISK